MKVALVRQNNNTLKCAYDSDYEYITTLSKGEVYFFEVKKERNLDFHRKFFALIKMVFENQEHYKNMEKLRKDLIISAGFFEEHITIWGETIQTAKSISFGKMDEDKFQELYNRVVDEIIKWFNFEKQLIIDNVQQNF